MITMRFHTSRRPSSLVFRLAVLFLTSMSEALIFRVDQFNDLSPACKNSDGKPLTYILNEDNPAMYISVDPSHPFKNVKRLRRIDQTKIFGNLADSRILHELTSDVKQPWHNTTFDCVLQIQTELPKGDKNGQHYDALSLIIIELNYSGHPVAPEYIQVSTFGHENHNTKKITKPAHYSDRIWAATNPNFLLSGQLSGFDSIDYRTKVDAQHIIKPETLHSTFDKPASIKVNLTRWTWSSHVYMVFTSYKHLRHGERCQEHKEFDCSPPSFLSSSNDHMCMSSNLACDGLPNCGQDFLPNQDENCFKIHWSSVLLSLVSYILLAITLLLCLSCFARVLIQWSVRSSLAELRGIGSPTGSFRSSSRFFSFLGSTFSSRWERPPPTYDEAMKHVNPDIARPQDPPAYSDTFSNEGGGGGNGSGAEVGSSGQAAASAVSTASATGRSRGSSSGGGIVETPPPDYECQDITHHNYPYLEINTTVVLPSSASHDTSQQSSSSAAALGHPAVVILPPTPSVAYSQQSLQQLMLQHTAAAAAAAAFSPEDATAALGQDSSPPADGGGSEQRGAASAKAAKPTTTATIEAEICPAASKQA